MARLNRGGSTRALRAELMPQGFAGEVLRLVAETWQGFTLHRSVRLEERVTALFATAIEDAYVAQGRTWFVFPEVPISDPTFGTQTGRNDLRFYHRNIPGQRNFFTIECKRLRVTTPSGFRHLAAEYVDDGLQRFADGKYAADLSCGAMLGYVMDNAIEAALASVRYEIDAKRPMLKMSTVLQVPCSLLPKEQFSAESRHVRTNGDFTTYHLLVGVPN